VTSTHPGVLPWPDKTPKPRFSYLAKSGLDLPDLPVKKAALLRLYINNVQPLFAIPQFPGAVVHVSSRCGARGVYLSRRGLWAHAHTDVYFGGLICVRPEAVGWKPDRRVDLSSTREGVAETLWHEWAHLVTANGHSPQWLALMETLGLGEGAQYHHMRKWPRERARQRAARTVDEAISVSVREL
jgi:hypothetical protein